MAEHYFLDPLAPFPKRWRDQNGPVRVLAGPAEGYVMVRRLGAMPFILRVSDLCNATKDPHHGPFELVEKNRKRLPLTQEQQAISGKEQ